MFNPKNVNPLDSYSSIDILKFLPEAIVVLDVNGYVKFINDAASKLLGLDEQSRIGLNIGQLDKGLQDPSAWSNLISEVRSFGETKYSTKVKNRTDEILIPVELTIRSTVINGEEVLIGSIRDVTAQLQTERDLQRVKEVIEQSSKLARVGGWDLDLVNQKLQWTDTVREIHEVPEDYEPDVSTAFNFYKEGPSRDFMMADMQAAIEHGAPLGIAEAELITAKGRTIWVRCMGEVVRENGKCVRVYGSIQDVDEQKRTAVKLEKSLDLLRRLTQNVPGAVYELELRADGSMHYPFVSAGISEIFEAVALPESGDLDEYLTRLIHAEDMKRVRHALLCSARNLEPVEIEFRHSNGNGLRHLQTMARPEKRDNGTTAWYGYLRDISDQKMRREELKSFAEMTAAQNERLLNFTYIVSHNIRSHVANLLGMLEIMKSDDGSSLEQFLPMMHESVTHLDESLRNLNDIVNIQSKVNLTRETISLREAVEKTLNSLRVQIRESDGVVNNCIPSDYTIESNPAYLESVLLNLISNAVKYRSPKRKLEVDIDVKREGNETLLAVSDNGMGINLQKYRDVVFGMYKTFHKNKDAKGLGLFITKTQVEALGGKIELESQEDKGTTVRVYFYG